MHNQKPFDEEVKVRGAKYMILWKPEALEDGGSTPLFYVFPHGTNPVHAVKFTGTNVPYVTEPLHYQSDIQGKLTLNITSYPVLIELSHSPIAPVVGF